MILAPDINIQTYLLTYLLTLTLESPSPASRLPMRTITLRSVLLGEVVHAGSDKQDSLMLGGLRGKRTSTLCAINYPTVGRRSC